MNAEGIRILNYLASTGDLANITLRNRDADAMMLRTGGRLMAKGILYDIICKKVSPGVCRLTLKRSN